MFGVRTWYCYMQNSSYYKPIAKILKIHCVTPFILDNFIISTEKIHLFIAEPLSKESNVVSYVHCILIINTANKTMINCSSLEA